MSEAKKYELRPLIASDMGAICSILSKIGIKQFQDCIKPYQDKDMKNTSVESIGVSVLFNIAGVVLSNVPRAEKDIQAFVASVAGIDVAEVETMPFADYGELIMQIVTKEDFKDFFGRVMKLFNR